MTRYVLIISLGLIFLTLISCTHNNGGDSRLYGTWRLQRISRAGVDDADYEGNVFWKFQNQTIEMQETGDLHTSVSRYGNCRLADETLFLSFPDADMPPLLGFDRESELQVVRLTGKDMVLSAGYPATMYYFKKW